MSETSKDFRRERVRSRRRKKFWQALGRTTLKLVIVARVVIRIIDLGTAFLNWIRN